MADNINLTEQYPSASITTDELENDLVLSASRTNGEERKNSQGFPLHVLPLKAQEFIKSAKKAWGIPQDFFAASIVFAAGSAVGNSYTLEIKKGAEEKAVMYLTLIGNPNCNKSGAAKTALKPLSNRDADNYREYVNAKAEYEVIMEMSKKERQAQLIETPAPPIFQRKIVQDVTPEAVAKALQESPRGITVYRDELAGFIKDFNRYNQGGEQEFWLSNWSGTTVSIDRKTSEPIRIKNPFISIIGTIQPAVIDSLGKGNRSVNGFIDRFLFVWPDDLEKPKWEDYNIDMSLAGAYNEAIEKLMDIYYQPLDEAQKLELEKDAWKTLQRFFNEDNKPKCDNAKNELLASMYGKFDLHTARLIIALHFIQFAYSRENDPCVKVNKQTVERAIELAKYFRDQSLKVYESIHESNPVEKLSRDKAELYEKLPQTFKTGQGEDIATNNGMPKRTFRDFIKRYKGVLFEKEGHGVYSKIY